jgi:hypothetical protein
MKLKTVNAPAYHRSNEPILSPLSLSDRSIPLRNLYTSSFLVNYKQLVFESFNLFLKFLKQIKRFENKLKDS